MCWLLSFPSGSGKSLSASTLALKLTSEQVVIFCLVCRLQIFKKRTSCILVSITFFCWMLLLEACLRSWQDFLPFPSLSFVISHTSGIYVLILASAIKLAGLRLYFAAVIAQINGELLKMGMLEHLGGLKAELEAEMVPVP